jgi:hypothetical protein
MADALLKPGQMRETRPGKGARQVRAVIRGKAGRMLEVR